MVELHELPTGDLLVFFRSCSMTHEHGCLTSDGGYGIFDANDTALRQLGLKEFYMLGDEELIRAASRALTQLRELTGLGATKADLCLS